jgi:membrane-bound serine protease (ClpP class)
MIRPLVVRPVPALWLALTVTLLGSFLTPVRPTLAAPPAPAPATAAAAVPETNPGQFFPVIEPISNEETAHLRAATKQLIDRCAAQGAEPILVFEFRPGEVLPGQSEFGACYDLANLISTKLKGAKRTVAYVPEPLKGYAVLAALACDEIVMGPEASLGPITPEGEPINPAYRDPVRFLAIRKGWPHPDLLLGMLDRNAELRAVRTANNQLHYVMAESLPEFEKTNPVIRNEPAWEGGLRGVLKATRAREEGFAKLIAEHPSEVAHAYQLAGQAATNDPTLGQIL